MFTIYAQLHEKDFVKSLSFDEMVIYLQDPQSVFWIDLHRPTDDEIHDLQDVFEFHPLCIEDCMSYSNSPKIDEFDDYIFLVTHEPHLVADTGELEKPEIDFFLGKNYLVSVHHHVSPAIDKTVQRCNAQLLYHQASIYTKGARNRTAIRDNVMFRNSDFILHAILDVVVDHYMPIVDAWDAEIDHVENRVLASTTDSPVLQDILRIKRRLASFRRVVSPQRDILSRMLHSESRALSKMSHFYFRDVHDHLIRVNEIIESHRDTMTSLLEAYYSVLSNQMNLNSNKMNFVMQRLTIITTIFMPLSFIAGVYGMNFVNMPELQWTYGYYFALGLMIMVAGYLYLFFREKRWF